MMPNMNAEELWLLMQEAAGSHDQDVSPDEFADQEFDVLGYDSLALIETAAAITDRYGVEIPDDRLFGLQRPREILDIVNGAVSEPQ
jgi:minimal PKS acyl carrier protein